MKKEEKLFITKVNEYYQQHGRHDLPWRKTTDPYKIAVSEIMLQQTQVARVIEKFKLFLKHFPTVKKLAEAPLGDVLLLWSGLGYNRRAKFLHQMAIAVVKKHKGVFPRTIEELLLLPGVGPYTSRAIAAFAFNVPSAFIETNIRSVYIHHFFRDGADILDTDIMPVIESTLDMHNPREWYWALMDYGSHLKSSGITAHRVSKHYAKQSKFNGSRRQIRGAILKVLLKESQSVSGLLKYIPKEKELIESVVEDLVKEGLIKKRAGKYSI